MRRRRVLAATALLATVPALVPAAALAAPTGAHRPGPWREYRTRPWTDAPGAVCSFGLRATPILDREQYRTLARYPDGRPRLQEYRGPLVVRYTNERTGASAVGNLSGVGFFRYERDGGLDGLFLDHGGVTVPVGDRAFPAGEWVISGQFTVAIAPHGTVAVTLYRARAVDMCRVLG